MNMDGCSTPTIAMDMIHSENELRHALAHLLRTVGEGAAATSSASGYLHGHETMTLYRNVRKKYYNNSSNKENTNKNNNRYRHDNYNIENDVDDGAASQQQLRDGLRQVCTFRTIEQGVLAAYQAGCSPCMEREASCLYVNVNPRSVLDGLKETYNRYLQWVEYKVGVTKQQVKKGEKENFCGTLDRVFMLQISRCKARGSYSLIDVDDNDPNTWLKQIRDALGENAIEMVIETKNGFHVVYDNAKMGREQHLALQHVLKSDTGKGKDASVMKMAGSSLACALPGTYQANHKTRIFYCSCSRRDCNGTR